MLGKTIVRLIKGCSAALAECQSGYRRRDKKTGTIYKVVITVELYKLWNKLNIQNTMKFSFYTNDGEHVSMS